MLRFLVGSAAFADSLALGSPQGHPWGYGWSSSTTLATCSATPTTVYHPWSYTVESTTRYATPLASPLQQTTTYGPHYSDASTLLPSSIIFTTYSLNPSASDSGVYGQRAYAEAWNGINFNVTVPFTTTVSPTAVASSELVAPPPLYTACPSSPGEDYCLDCYKLPKDFIWGVAGSAWQIEGGLKSEGRGPSYKDLTGALPADGEATPEVTVMNYFLYKQDIARLAAIGIPYYSFSISWTRIVPFGTVGSPINQQGIDHYDDLINTCIEYGITPVATLTHADNPLNLTFAEPGFADAFLYYAQVALSRYSNRIPYWFTLNEPNVNYGDNYTAVPHILMGHAKVYHWYREVLKGTGLMSLKFSQDLGFPLDATNATDVRAALRYMDFNLGILANPIFRGENYPAEVLQQTAGTNLTALTPDELSYINGTADFFAFDPYTTFFCTSPPNGIDACASSSSDPNWPYCVSQTNVQEDGWLNGYASYGYAYITPQYFRQHLGYAWNTFKPRHGVMIAEFGFNPFMEYARAFDAQRFDLERTLYYEQFLREMLKSIYEDGVNVIGAIAWAYVDNDEWGSYEQQYGMQYCNRSNPAFPRSYKRSMFDYVDFFTKYVRE